MVDHARETSVTKRLRRARAWSRVSLFAERLAPAVLPLTLVVSAFLILSWSGIFRAVPDWGRIALGVVLAIAAVASLYPLRNIRFATSDEIDRRLERENALTHQPITTQDDKIATDDDAFARTLWALHQEKLAAQIENVKGAKAKSSIPQRDPWALRTLVPLGLVTAFAFSFGIGGGSLGDAFRSHSQEAIIPARIDAWITPPGYTGVAPIFMTSDINAQRDAFTAPEGSKIVVRIAGGTGVERVLFPDGETELAAAESEDRNSDASARQFEVVARTGGTLKILNGGENTDDEDALNSWLLSITEDNAPKIAFDGELERAVNGALTMNYIAEDDFRIARGDALVTLADEQKSGARPLYGAPEIALVLPRRNAEGKAKTTINVTEHPWAGAKVNIVLEAEDDLEQIGRSETIETVLPGRPFSNRLARALIEQRRILALDATEARNVYDMLDLFMLYPEETINNTAHFLGLTTAQAKLRYSNTDDDLREVVDYLWEVARNIEDGGLSDAERRLKDAQQALRDALERGASEEEIAAAMQELREAMQDFLREFAEQNRNNPNMQAQQNQQNAQELDQQSLDEMLDRLEEMAQSGAREQAMDMLSQLEDMMNNLQMGQHAQQQGDGGQSQAQQQMNELGEILREQQQLMDETFQRQQGQQGQEGQQGQNQQGQQGQGQQGQNQPGQQGQGQQPGQGQQGQGQAQQGQQGQGQNGQQPGQGQGGQQQAQGGLQGLAPGQQALQQRLEEFMQGLQGMGINPGDSFEDAQRSMGQAGDALGEGAGDQALNDQGNAMDALREGAQSMMQQMQQANQGQTGASEPGGNQMGDARDPLGRPQRSSGPNFDSNVDVPDEIDIRRAREILEAIRRRLGEGGLQLLERDYLERLLELN